jgi:RHS repeat-associated protein
MGDWLFSYDTLNRLTSSLAMVGPYASQNGCWAYDSFGNRTAESWQTAACPTPETSVPATASYNGSNQVTWTSVNAAVNGFTYDSAGNVIYDGANYYAYDAEGRLCAVQTRLNGSVTGQYQYLYNAEGTRVGKASFTGTFPWKTTCAAPGAASGFNLTNQYLLDQGGNQVTELNGTGGWVHSNVWAGAHLDATYDTSGLHFHLADPLGTRRVQANVYGVIEENFQSLPFGDGLAAVANPNCLPANHCYSEDATEHHFTGKERDTESGNDYFGARYYASSMGRWLSPDWSVKTEPVPYAKLGDPQTLNLYAYVGNNPLSRADADGHESGYQYSPDTYGMRGPGDPDYDRDVTSPQAVRTQIQAMALMSAPFLGSAIVSELGRPALALAARIAGPAYLALNVMGTRAAQTLVSARDAVSGSLGAIKDAAASGEISLSGPTASRLSSAMNSISNNFTNSDINGAVKQSITGVEAGGDHVQELLQTGNSLASLSKILTGALQNPNLSDQTRSLFQGAVNAIKPAIDQIYKLQL